MRLHERTIPVQDAENELATFTNSWMTKHDLTYLEAIGALLTRALDFKKYALRVERHPDDPDKKGDEA